MYRTVPYIVLFLILALLQIFLFDNLSISIYLCPLVYIGFIVLLPIDAPPVAVLFLALSMSVAMDWAMGAAGINTIATLPVAMLRRPLLYTAITRAKRHVIIVGERKALVIAIGRADAEKRGTMLAERINEAKAAGV